MRVRALASRALARGRTALSAGALGIAIVAAGCGGGGATAPQQQKTAPPPPKSPTDITVANNVFNPGTATVPAGSTVTWTWDSCSGGDAYGNGQTCVDHSVVWDADGTSSGVKSQGSYQKVFPTAGTYTYHCSIHGAAMKGAVTVQ